MQYEEDFDRLDESRMEEKKRWLFKESMRLEEIRKQLEDERRLIEIQKGLLERQQRKNMLLRKQLENQKDLFDRQWQLLENETRRLVSDKEQFERDKLRFKDNIMRETRRSLSVTSNIGLFYKGVQDMASLKQRHRSLLKIYHPDNIHGDNALILALNEEYERLTRFYLGT